MTTDTLLRTCKKFNIIFKEVFSALPFIGVEHAHSGVSFYVALNYFRIFNPMTTDDENPMLQFNTLKRIIH